MSKVKEPGFFSLPNPTPEDERSYLNWFDPTPKTNILGEASLYLCGRDIPGRIADKNPNAKLLFCYRNPLERALSHYQYRLGRGDETRPLGVIIDQWRTEAKNIVETESPFDGFVIWYNLYAHHTQIWLKHFPKEQCLFLRQEDLKDDFAGTLKTICQFLNVNDTFNFINHGPVNTTAPAQKEVLAALADQGITWNKGTGHYNRPNIEQSKRQSNDGLRAVGDFLKPKTAEERKRFLRGLDKRQIKVMQIVFNRENEALKQLLGPKFIGWDIDASFRKYLD